MNALSHIISWFKGDQPSPVAPPSSPDQPHIDGISAIYFHEDDYCQIELVPAENEAYLIAEGAQIQQSAEQNFDGQGYTNIHVRSEEPVPLSARNISFGSFSGIFLGLSFQRIDRVYSGYSTHHEHLANTVAFKLSPYVIYLDHKDEIVQHIWLDVAWKAEPAHRERFAEGLRQVGSKWQLVLMHWAWTRMVDLNNRAALEEYLTVYPE